jgi:hypothetical protein
MATGLTGGERKDKKAGTEENVVSTIERVSWLGDGDDRFVASLGCSVIMPEMIGCRMAGLVIRRDDQE